MEHNKPRISHLLYKSKPPQCPNIKALQCSPMSSVQPSRHKRQYDCSPSLRKMSHHEMSQGFLLSKCDENIKRRYTTKKHDVKCWHHATKQHWPTRFLVIKKQLVPSLQFHWQLIHLWSTKKGTTKQNWRITLIYHKKGTTRQNWQTMISQPPFQNLSLT